jgi:hypothetical protein
MQKTQNQFPPFFLGILAKETGAEKALDGESNFKIIAFFLYSHLGKPVQSLSKPFHFSLILLFSDEAN